MNVNYFSHGCPLSKNSIRHNSGLKLLIFFITLNIPITFAVATTLKSHPSIISLSNFDALSRGELVSKLAKQEIVILGEVHDNVVHHQIHGQLINEINHARKVSGNRKKDQNEVTIIVEHLPAGSAVQFDSKLDQALNNAGFNPKAWNWPIHESLFSAIGASGLALRGGSLSMSDGREMFSSGGASAPAPLKRLIERSTLSDSSQQILFKEIQDGHCGLFPENKIPQMAQVQRARDASLAYEAVAYAPSILIVGNGHAWNDIGVPQIIRANYANKSIASILFIEDGGINDPQKLALRAKNLAGKADYVWFTSTTQRADPCEKLR
jgi:uncharacterized iron-regulated protein